MKLKLINPFFISFLILFLTSSKLIAASKISSKDYCDEYALGWHFYCQKQQEEESPKAELKKSSEDDAEEKLKEIQAKLESKKVKAIIYPTPENIKDYAYEQKQAIDKASVFSDQWRRVVWQNPDLDYTLKRPVSKIGKETFTDQRNQDIAKTIRDLNQRYGIFFLFRSDCHFCHAYSPIIQSFAAKYSLNIIPVSMDGGSMPGWSKILTNQGQIERMGIEVKSVPATILFDKQTRKIIPVGFGIMSHSDLEERIFALIKLEVGDDY